MKIYVVTPHYNPLVEMVLMRGHNMCFNVAIWLNIPKLSLLPLLIWSAVDVLISGWNELLIAAFSHRSISVKDGILLATGLHVHRSSAHQAGVGTIFDRVLTELVSKMREMKMDKTELGCLRAIVLFNPGKSKIIIQKNLSYSKSMGLAEARHWYYFTTPDGNLNFSLSFPV